MAIIMAWPAIKSHTWLLSAWSIGINDQSQELQSFLTFSRGYVHTAAR